MNKFFRFGVVVIAFGLVPFAARAAGLAYSSDTLVSIGSATYTIAAGSEATTVVVGATSITVTVPSGSSFTFKSPDRYVLNTDTGLIANCFSTDSRVVISTASTVVITPDSDTSCATSGGGVGGGGGSITPPPTPGPAPAPSGSHPNGTLVLGSDGKTVYLIKDGQRYAFRDAAEYKSHGFSFSQIVPASPTDNALPLVTGNIIKALEGTLAIDSADGKTVYMIGLNNTKRGFSSAKVFSELGYSFANLPKINLSDYQLGPVINVSTEAHPEGSLVRETNGTVWWILGGKRQGFESLAVFNTYGFAITRIVKINTADLALPQGPLVKFRDGTLVKDGDAYYLISDGKKLAFASVAVLVSKGYQTSNAIIASLANYTAGSNNIE
jgi:hypothetical protein